MGADVREDECSDRPQVNVGVKPTVLILVTCRKPELSRYATLVFDTLRIGFPTARIIVYLNSLEGDIKEDLLRRAFAVGAECCETATIHHDWINERLVIGQEPFWLVDTDVIFYQSVENWRFGESPLAGFRVPEFSDSFSGCITRSRLHTSLLYVNPVEVRRRLVQAWEGAEETPFTPRANLIDPLVVMHKQQRYFYDTCSLLYHAVGGTAFTDEQKDAYCHMHFGSISDVVLPRLPELERKVMLMRRDAILRHPVLGKGAWREQDAYYENRHPRYDGQKVEDHDVRGRNGEEAQSWNQKICCGDKDAMAFLDLWYRYCHGIDDLIDTMEDGRPTMAKDQIIGLFFKAAILYNTVFFKRHSTFLLPIVLQITNTYADSVAWERSPVAHRRAMADVMRMAGNEMYNMVALLCGGEQHMRELSPQIKEGDWLGQH